MKIKPVNKLFSSFESSSENNYHSQTFSLSFQTRRQWEEEETVHKEQFKGIYARHRKKKKRQEKYSWMSLVWLWFFGTSVNGEEKENSCGLRAEKFFARTKHSSSRLHSSWSKDNVLSDNHANDVGQVQELRKTRIFGTCRKQDLIGKFNFLDDEKVNREKEKLKLVIAHLYFIMNIFLRIFIQMFCLVYSTIKIGDTTTSSTSSSAMERSFEKLSMLSAKTSVSAGHSALQNSWSREWKKKIRLWSILFSSSPSKWYMW